MPLVVQLVGHERGTLVLAARVAQEAGAAQVQHVAQVASGCHCAGQVALGHHQQVGDLEVYRLRGKLLPLIRLERLLLSPNLSAREGQSFLRGGTSRIWHMADLQSFTPLRFLPPKLMNWQGRAVVTDPDVFAVGDVYELLQMDMLGYCHKLTYHQMFSRLVI